MLQSFNVYHTHSFAYVRRVHVHIYMYFSLNNNLLDHVEKEIYT